MTEDNAREFWELRFEALRVAEEAFGASYQEEMEKSRELRISRFNKEYINDIMGNFILGAFDDDNKLIGTIGLHRETRIKLRHKATIWGMYVSSQYRKRSVGKLLITEAINLAKSMGGLEQLNLAVVSSNINAINLYKTVGFMTYGKEKNAIKLGNKYFDEDYMVHFVK